MWQRVAFLLCASAALAAAGDGAMTPAERFYLLDQLELSKKNLLASIDGLTEAQWKFKPAANVWSVEECAEHLILAEEFIFNEAMRVLKTPAVPRPVNSNAEFDRQFAAGVQDRSHKLTAPEPITPSGTKYATPADAAREFTARRDKTIAYVKSTENELRGHVGPGPAGQMDAYQFILLIAAHSGRHTQQIQEVRANPGYPKAAAE